MKSDKYLKVILTIIAISLVWICIRDVKIGGSKLFANGNSSEPQEVYVSGGSIRVSGGSIDVDRIWKFSKTAFTLAEPIQVEIASPEQERK